MTIHSSDPFATPESARSPVRRLRGRLPTAVTLWTAVDPEGGRVGLTVSSTMVIDGAPGRLLGLIDPESELLAAVQRTGSFAVIPLRGEDRQLADAFAGLIPAPGGPFARHSWQQTEFGPVLADAPVWVGCRCDEARPVGWGVLVEATIARIEFGPDSPPLVHFRGRYRGIEG